MRQQRFPGTLIRKLRPERPLQAWFWLPVGFLVGAGFFIASLTSAVPGATPEQPRETPGESGKGIAQAAIPKPGETNNRARPGAFVEVIVLKPRDFALSSTYVGYLLPWERVQLKAEVEGTVEEVSFDEGDAVGPKDALARVSSSQFALRRDLAREDLKLAESNFQRDADLATKHLIPTSRLDQSRSARDVARLRLDLAEIDLAKSIPHSPIVGFVKTKGVEKGEFVNKGTLIAEILDLRRVRAKFNVPEGDVRHLKAGKLVTLNMDALPGQDFTGKVLRVGLEADLNTRTFPVEAELDNPEGRLRPGMLTRVRVELAGYVGQILVPRHAVLEREHGRVVFVVEEGRARERTVRTGVSIGGEVQIIKGLKAGEHLIVTGQQKLVPDEPVRIVDTGKMTPQR